MIHRLFQDWQLILASQSPRRQQLLKGLDVEFQVQPLEVDEVFPEHLAAEEVPIFLSRLKADAFLTPIPKKTLLITADTTVILEGKTLNKPANETEACSMLERLSGRQHKVITGVTLKSTDKTKSFSDCTTVQFRNLTPEEIAYYIDKYQPYDKAGSYGIQEWIGYIGIEKIEGCYFNVMGLPLQRLNEEMLLF